MGIVSLKTNQLNQNQYNRNLLTPEFIGSLVIYPIDYIIGYLEIKDSLYKKRSCCKL